MLKHIAIDELQPGMFVNQVVEQSGSLRMRSKGLVKTQGAIDALKTKGILVVEIDTDKSTTPTTQETGAEPEKPARKKDTKLSHSEALNKANDLYTQAMSIQGTFINGLKSGAGRDLTPVVDLSQSIIDSVFDNQDALSCLTMIKDTDSYLLEHSINCSILMSMFASHLGYDRETIEQACLGALLMDVGMSSIPEELRYSTQSLSKSDWELIKTHVDIGVELVEQCGDISDLALNIIAQHHERNDGSGYPKALKNEDISLFAKMAAIIDSYDAMISKRPHQESVAPAAALKRLVKQSSLDHELVNQFVQCVGVHPVGSLVRLKSGKLGIVSQAGKTDLLSPIVMTFYSTNSGHYNEIKRLDLSKSDDEVVSGVRPDDFGIDLPKFFREVFIHQVP